MRRSDTPPTTSSCSVAGSWTDRFRRTSSADHTVALVEVSALVLASLLATVIPFLALRTWVFGRRRDGLRGGVSTEPLHAARS